MDNLLYRCKHCEAQMPYSAAKTHPSGCVKRPEQFQPPSYVYDWNEINIVRRPTISNPLVGPEETRRDRLLIYHHNGRQLASKFVNATWDIPRVKLQIARLTEQEAVKIKLFKFYHEELSDTSLVRDIATKQGATHITSLTDLRGLDHLASSTAVISFHDVGPQPHVARPKSERVRGRTQI